MLPSGSLFFHLIQEVMSMRQFKSITSVSIYSLSAPIFGVVALLSSAAHAALLYNPVVTEVGNGVTPLTNAGAPTTIQVYANGVAGQVAPLAQATYANGMLVNTGNSVTEGELANNPGVADAATAGLPYGGTAYVFSAGYGAKDGTPAVNTTSAARSVGDMTVTASSVSGASVPLSQPGGSAYAPTGNIRAAVGDDAVANFWSAGTSTLGGTAGYKYFNTNTALQNPVGPTNTRTVQIRQGQLYGSSDTNGFIGISLIGIGTPQVGGQTITPLFQTGTSGASSSPEAFSLIDDPNVSTPTIGGVNVPFNVAYVADSSFGTGNILPGIQKWVYSPTTLSNNGWSLDYIISDFPGDGYNGLAAELVHVTALRGISFDDILLFSTNNTNTAVGGNSLEEFVDPLEGGTAAATDASVIDLADAPANDEFRGVALAPVSVPEPASFAAAGLALFGLLSRRRRAGATFPSNRL
jgi:PEP-CTERM motif